MALCANEDHRKFPRRTRRVLNLASIVCCDTPDPTTNILIHNETATSTTDIEWFGSDASYLDDVDCVPFCDRNYNRCWQDPNRVGKLFYNYRYCDTPENDDRFRFPRPIGNDGFDITTGRYQCCKTGPALPPFIQDAAFHIEVYTLLSIYCIAVIASVLVTLGLLIPLLIQLFNKASSGSRRKRSSSVFLKPATTDLSGKNSSSLSMRSRSVHTSSRRSSQATWYSPYNLYLVYLAIPDFVLSLWLIFGLCLPMIYQQNIAFTFHIPTILAYGFANTVKY